MADFPSWADLFRIARDEVLSRNPRLSRDAVERQGSDANILVAAASAAADEVVGQLVGVSAGQFLDSASGAALDRLVFDRYGLVRKAAAVAQGSVQFSTGTPNPSQFTIPDGTKLQSITGVQYITVGSVIFPAASSGPILAAVRSVLAGATQQASIGTITSITGSISGAPGNLTVTNPIATSGADDIESDDSLRDRARRFFQTARRATKAALEEGALAVPGVRKAAAFEVLDASGRPARLALLVVTDAFSEALVDYSVAPPAYQTQSQLLASTVFAALDDVRACGIYVQVQVANVVLVGVQLALSFTAGADIDAVAQNARAVVVGAINDLLPGETLDPTTLVAALGQVDGLVITGNEIVSPSGPIVPTPTQVLRTDLGLTAAVSAQAGRTLIPTTNPDAFII
jgi:uncharacterized phage protein gp47/JayE